MDVVINFGLTPLTWSPKSKLSQGSVIKKLTDMAGLRAWKDSGLAEDEFVHLLTHLMSKPKLVLFSHVFFDSYSLSSKDFPTYLYMMGFGHLLEQNLIPTTPLVNHFKHQTVLQPFLRNSDDMLPTLGHDPVIEFRLDKKYIFEDRYPRKFITHVEIGENKFFIFLGISNVSVRQHNWLEGYAYSLAALDCNILHIYKASAYCNLAICMAQLALSSEMTWLALERAIYCHQHIGQQYEWMCACLEILIAFGHFEVEKQVFATCKEFIPEASAWFECLLNHHLTGIVQQIENQITKCFIEFHTSKDVLFECKDVTFLNQLLKDIDMYSNKLTSRGCKEYYQGLGLIFKSIIKSHRPLKSRYLKSGQDMLRIACSTMRTSDTRRIEASQLVSYLNNDIDNVEEICQHWRTYNSCFFSTCAAEVLLKCALINMGSVADVFESLWFNTHEMTFQAKEEYMYSTFSCGYRLDMLTALDKFHEPQPEKQPMKFDLFKASENFTLVNESENQGMTSRDFVHCNPSTEQAYKLAFLICNKTEDDILMDL